MAINKSNCKYLHLNCCLQQIYLIWENLQIKKDI
nr:MAG TPA: hypothetical protein [Caudoviricetes sp.]